MSFDDSENSLASGQPIRLYQFNRGTRYWCYCSGAMAITFEGRTYQAIDGGIQNDSPQQSGDSTQDDLTITAAAEIGIAQLFRGAPPSEAIAVRIYDMHLNQSDARLSYVGTVSNVKWPALDRCNIICRTRSASMQDPGLTWTYMRSCTAVVGDNRCRVNLDGYRVDGTVDSLDGAQITVNALSGYSDGYFAGGYVAWVVSSGDYDRRHIESQSGSVLTLLGGTSGLSLNQSVRLFPGCDFTMDTCGDKFNNIDNFRGIPQLQGDSPFDGKQVW